MIDTAISCFSVQNLGIAMSPVKFCSRSGTDSSESVLDHIGGTTDAHSEI